MDAVGNQLIGDPVVIKDSVVIRDSVVIKDQMVSKDSIVMRNPVVIKDSVVIRDSVVIKDPMVSKDSIVMRNPVVISGPVAMGDLAVIGDPLPAAGPPESAGMTPAPGSRSTMMPPIYSRYCQSCFLYRNNIYIIGRSQGRLTYLGGGCTPGGYSGLHSSGSHRLGTYVPGLARGTAFLGRLRRSQGLTPLPGSNRLVN